MYLVFKHFQGMAHGYNYTLAMGEVTAMVLTSGESVNSVVFPCYNHNSMTTLYEDNLGIWARWGLHNIFPLQTPTIVDNLWIYWVISLLSTKNIQREGNRRFSASQLVLYNSLGKHLTYKANHHRKI